jgi:hypothetical protein
MSDDEARTPTSNGLWAWLTNRAGLIILVVLAAIVGFKLTSSLIKWMLIAVVIGATVYLVKGALRRADER